VIVAKREGETVAREVGGGGTTVDIARLSLGVFEIDLLGINEFENVVLRTGVLTGKSDRDRGGQDETEQT
jgi:hypothetical protein